jgi:tetrahydromethanopterin S-methyltransferase subunit H
MSGTPSPSIVVSAHVGPNSLLSDIFGRGTGALTYYFEIEGPAGAAPVLIDVAGAATGLASLGATFAVTSQWALYDSVSLSTKLAGDELRSMQITGSFNDAFDRTVSVTLNTNHVYPIFLFADANAAATAAGSNAIADAFVDPVFSFGPSVDPLA